MFPYTEKVKRGMALLDKEHPGWRDKVDQATLDLTSGCGCVLGQVFGHYNSGLYILWGIDAEAYDYYEWVMSSDFQTAVTHGFSIDLTADTDTEWQVLREAWMAELDGSAPHKETTQ